MVKNQNYFVLYDGFCLLCGKARKFIERFDWFGLISTVNLYDKEAMKDLGFEIPSAETLLYDVHIISRAGKIYRGFYAWRKICSLLPITFLLVPLLYFPGVPYLGEKVYRYIADNRK